MPLPPSLHKNKDCRDKNEKMSLYMCREPSLIIEAIASFWRENMLRYLSPFIICSEKRTVIPDRSSRKIVSFLINRQYSSISLGQMEAIVFIIIIILPYSLLWGIRPQMFIILQKFLTTHFEAYHSDIPQFKLGHIQSCDAFWAVVSEQKYLMDYNN